MIESIIKTIRPYTTSIIISAIVAYITVRIQNSVDKKKSERKILFEVLYRIYKSVCNMDSVKMQDVNEIKYYQLQKYEMLEEFSEQLIKYNELVDEHLRLLKVQLIDLYLRGGTGEEESMYMEHQFDNLTNTYLNKMAYYLSHKNWKQWIITDFETVNFFKKRTDHFCSDGFELYGIDIFMNALEKGEFNEDIFMDTYFCKEAIKIRKEVEEEGSLILNKLNYIMKRFV